MNPWTPELEVSPDLARRLIETQFPALKPARLSLCGTGWDNVVYSVNDEWYFRFPQREIAVEGVQREVSVLPMLGAWLDQIPRIEFNGAACADYPWPFFGYRPVRGEEPARLDLRDRAKLAAQVGRFLKTLHGPEIFARFADSVPGDKHGRLDFIKRIPMTEKRFAELAAQGIKLPETRLREILHAALGTPRLPHGSLVHGDLHFRHIIASPEGDFRGLIDWGDLHLNDPALDLQLYWSFFTGNERRTFLEAYGPMSEAQKIQSRSFAVFLNIAILTAAVDQKQDFILQEAQRSLARILED